MMVLLAGLEERAEHRELDWGTLLLLSPIHLMDKAWAAQRP